MDSTLQFLLIILALELTPGPAVLMVLFQASLSLRHVAAAICGLLTANVVWITLVATGLGLLITRSPLLYDALRFIGALYLVYLGYKIIRFGIRPTANVQSGVLQSYRRSYLQGILTSFSNPKALVFFMALFPPFVRAEHFSHDIVYFGALKMLMLALVMGSYGVLGQQIFAGLRHRQVSLWVSWLLGLGIIAAGVALALNY